MPLMWLDKPAKRNTSLMVVGDVKLGGRAASAWMSLVRALSGICAETTKTAVLFPKEAKPRAGL